MPKLSKAQIDADLRSKVFEDIIVKGVNDLEFHKINDRQYGVLLTDLNGIERYVRLGAIVAEERTDMTARELMESEIKLYQTTQAEKERKAEERAKKAEADQKRREEKARLKAEKEKEKAEE